MTDSTTQGNQEDTQAPDQNAAARREVLLAAIENVQATIGSLEGRVPMALILHGLLFAGLLQVTLALGALWHHEWAQWVLGGELAFTALGFLVSVLAFIASVGPPAHRRAVVAYRDLGFDESGGPPDPSFLFPHWKWKFQPRRASPAEADEGPARLRFITFDFWRPKARSSSEKPYEVMLGKMHDLGRHTAFEEILTAELLVVSTFRAYKSALARWGFWWLRFEIVTALAYLVTSGVAHLKYG